MFCSQFRFQREPSNRPLPKSRDKAAIFVFFARLTKVIHLVPCIKEVITTQYAQFFMDNVFWLQGMPKVIISDWDPRFIRKFWTELFSILGAGLQFSIAFRSQIDGQPEVTIWVLEDFLWPYVKHRSSASFLWPSLQ